MDSKNTHKAHLFAQQSQQSDAYTARLPFGSTKKTESCDTNNFISNIWGNPLPESCVGLFITLCTEWILQKNIKTNMFAQQSQKS